MKIPLFFTNVDEARKANLHAYKRIIIRPAIYERGLLPPQLLLRTRTTVMIPFHRICTSRESEAFRILLACVTGVQRGGRGEVAFEREARSLGSRRESTDEIPTIALRAPVALLEFNFPLPPLCTPTTQASFLYACKNQYYATPVLPHVSFSSLTAKDTGCMWNIYGLIIWPKSAN